MTSYRRRKNNYERIALIAFIFIVLLITCTIIVFASNAANTDESIDSGRFVVPTTETSVSENSTSENVAKDSVESGDNAEIDTVVTESQETFVSLGEFKLTAYCPCTKCCGKWGENRPTDANGNMIVVTASGRYAKENWTVAADTSMLPFGTRIYINGYEYEVQDRGGAIKENRIDIYFDDHQEALNFGIQYAEVMIKVVEGE